jgi:hypothetical protein
VGTKPLARRTLPLRILDFHGMEEVVGYPDQVH